MNISPSNLLCLLCCPPCPSAIVSKLAFMPPEPTYRLRKIAAPSVKSKHHKNDSANGTHTVYSIELLPAAEWQYSNEELADRSKIQAFFARTPRGNDIACLHIKGSQEPRFTILYSHGNAVDLGQMCNFYYGLAHRLECNIFSYDYSGYGASTGRSSERNIYIDANAAFNALHTRYNLLPEDMVFYGQSIGTVPTTDLASRYQAAGVILHSPLMSGLRVVFPKTKRSWFFDFFSNIDKVHRIGSPVLVIHGTEDDVVGLSHGLGIYEKCPIKTEPLWIEGAGHNDIDLYQQYLERLEQFLFHELPSR